MGYCITDKKPGESFDRLWDAYSFATQEEYDIARTVFDQECKSSLRELKETLPEDLANIVYFSHLDFYIVTVKQWMNENPPYVDSRPSDSEDAFRRLYISNYIKEDIKNYLDGKSFPVHRIMYYYPWPDDIAEECQKELYRGLRCYCKQPAKISNDMIPIESAAYLLIDFKDILPVRITNRKGFLYYCESIDDGQTYTVPCNRLFQTEEAAQNKIKERNGRRNTFIGKYHLLDESEDDNVNKKRAEALARLDLNSTPTKSSLEELRKYLNPPKATLST